MGAQITVGQVITNLQFSFNASIKPSAMWVAIHSAESGKMWRHLIDIGGADEYVLNDIDVSFENGWTAGPGSTLEEFKADMETVDWVGIFVRRGGTTEAQYYRMDYFIIEGYTNESPIIVIDSDGDGMPDEWEILHELNPFYPDDAGVDYDGDGMINYAEYLTGTDPNDNKSVFGVEPRVSNTTDDNQGYVLEWTSISNREYDVMRSTNFIQSFEVLEEGIPATPPRNMFTDHTATNGLSFFYKVRVWLKKPL
jgi:hypothetical protein